MFWKLWTSPNLTDWWNIHFRAVSKTICGRWFYNGPGGDDLFPDLPSHSKHVMLQRKWAAETKARRFREKQLLKPMAHGLLPKSCWIASLKSSSVYIWIMLKSPGLSSYTELYWLCQTCSPLWSEAPPTPQKLGQPAAAFVVQTSWYSKIIRTQWFKTPLTLESLHVFHIPQEEKLSSLGQWNDHHVFHIIPREIIPSTKCGAPISYK